MFSISQCYDTMRYSFESFDSIGCGEQWRAAMDCMAGLDCDVFDKSGQCQSQNEALYNCGKGIQQSSGSDVG